MSPGLVADKDAEKSNMPAYLLYLVGEVERVKDTSSKVRRDAVVIGWIMGRMDVLYGSWGLDKIEGEPEPEHCVADWPK
jgi:hypothetical protein